MKDNPKEENPLVTTLQVEISSNRTEESALAQKNKIVGTGNDSAEDGFRYDYDDASDLYRG